MAEISTETDIPANGTLFQKGHFKKLFLCLRNMTNMKYLVRGHPDLLAIALSNQRVVELCRPGQ
jgi:hypothetical protein